MTNNSKSLNEGGSIPKEKDEKDEKDKRNITGGNDKEKEWKQDFIISNLRELYKKKILPIERKYHMYSFLLPTGGEIRDAEFDARPMVLLLGQYSTGKTSFIRYVLGDVNFPGMHIGPEPTTDKFIALVHGDSDIIQQESTDDKEHNQNEINDEQNADDLNSFVQGKIMKGNSLTVMPQLPFASLSSFGSSFLNHFQGSICPALLLKSVTLIDTPGILSGEKQRLSRAYDFSEVTKWFADRSDLILILFDSHKLDISDEMKQIIHKIRPNNDDKIRCVLNKADGVQKEQFVRIYGSLMWSMGKIFQTPEVSRVYTGSYWSKAFEHKDFQKMFEADEKLLINELKSLPLSIAERKVNEIVKRIRLVKVHVCILSEIRHRLPLIFGTSSARTKILNQLNQIFDFVKVKYSLSPGDMPDIHLFREKICQFEDLYSIPTLDQTLLDQLDDIIQTDIPNLMRKASNGIITDAKWKAKAQVQRVLKRGTNLMLHNSSYKKVRTENAKKNDKTSSGQKNISQINENEKKSLLAYDT